MKKILMVVAQDGFQEWEYGVPREIFEQSGVEVKVASFEKGAAVGAEGLIIRAEMAVSEVDAKDFDAVVFVGGGGMVQNVKDSRLINLAKDFFEAGKIVAAICIAPCILADAGLLKNKKATVCDGAEKILEKAGAIYRGAEVETDEKIITAKDPMAAGEFGKTIVEHVK